MAAPPLYDTGGRQIGAVETIREVPQDRAADESRGMPEEQVRILASSLPDMIFTLGRDGTFTQFFWTGGWTQASTRKRSWAERPPKPCFRRRKRTF